MALIGYFSSYTTPSTEYHHGDASPAVSLADSFVLLPQVPQFLLDDAWAAGRSCRMICTQPRRISAMTVADRVAFERGERIGDGERLSLLSSFFSGRLPMGNTSMLHIKLVCTGRRFGRLARLERGD